MAVPEVPEVRRGEGGERVSDHRHRRILGAVWLASRQCPACGHVDRTAAFRVVREKHAAKKGAA